MANNNSPSTPRPAESRPTLEEIIAADERGDTQYLQFMPDTEEDFGPTTPQQTTQHPPTQTVTRPTQPATTESDEFKSIQMPDAQKYVTYGKDRQGQYKRMGSLEIKHSKWDVLSKTVGHIGALPRHAGLMTLK